MRPERTRWRLLRKLPNVILKLLAVITEKSLWLEEVPDAWRKVNVTTVVRKGKREELRDHQHHASLQENDGSHGRHFNGPKT